MKINENLIINDDKVLSLNFDENDDGETGVLSVTFIGVEKPEYYEITLDDWHNVAAQFV